MNDEPEEPEGSDEPKKAEGASEPPGPLEGWPGSPGHLRFLDELYCR